MVGALFDPERRRSNLGSLWRKEYKETGKQMFEVDVMRKNKLHDMVKLRKMMNPS
jgi:hypothetical protein